MHKDWQSIYKLSYISGYNPFLLKNMNKALERVVKAINDREKIVIYGCCDVDGICGISLLLLVLKYLNADVEYYLPEEESNNYYLDSEVLTNHIKFLGATLVITVGCNILNSEQEKLCRDLNLDVIITDYKANFYDSSFISINPKDKKNTYRYKNLSASGVVFKLTQALAIYYNMKSINKYIDLVFLGEYSAKVPTSGENRVIYEEGFKHLNRTYNYGLQALMKYNIKDSCTDEDVKEIIRILTPTVNAVGRLDNARISVELLTTSDKYRAEQIAKYLTKEVSNVVS